MINLLPLPKTPKFLAKWPVLKRAGLLLIAFSILATAAPSDAQKTNAELYKGMRYGLFSHVVYRLTIAADGKKSYRTLDEFVAPFDVKAYADQLKSIGVEYLIFTAWHAGIYNLGPNDALEKWLPGHTSKRDLIGELADALGERGIKMIIYAHPNDAHDLKPEEQERIGFYKRDHKAQPGLMPVYDEFINEVYTEMAKRYAHKPAVIGYWWDSYHVNGGAIDPKRLRESLLREAPGMIILSNYPNSGLIDFHCAERYYNKVTKDDIDGLVAMQSNQSATIAGIGLMTWWCSRLDEVCYYSPESLFKFTVLNACTGAPGGMAFAMSPSNDGKTWSGDHLPILRSLNALIQKIRPTICGVAPSTNWKVKNYTTNSNAVNYSESLGYGATRKLDGTVDYLHVLKVPAGKSIDLLPAKDKFKSARLYSNNHPVGLETTPGGLRLTLGDADQWDPLDTVIVLERDVPAKGS